LRILLIRHTEAAPGDPDELRPLTDAGRASARALGERLLADGLVPDAVLTSPLLRARETGEAVARASGSGIAAEPDDRLAPGATLAGVRAAVAGRGELVAVVAHQPDCSQIAAAVTGGPEPAFPPGHALALEL
jgi:phosphohistidine phosphatase